MESKYYTPEKEEFHIGFEYLDKIRIVDISTLPVGMSISEYITNNPGYETDNEYVWRTIILDDIYNVPFFYTTYADGSTESVVPEFIKVKYLDKEDIESLGFTDYQHSVCDWYKLEGRFEDSFATHGYWTKIRLIHCFDKIKIMAYEYSWEEIETILYQGSCKNKSELKKLMQMLKINKVEEVNV
jgi:hypothetical protein